MAPPSFLNCCDPPQIRSPVRLEPASVPTVGFCSIASLRRCSRPRRFRRLAAIILVKSDRDGFVRTMPAPRDPKPNRACASGRAEARPARQSIMHRLLLLSTLALFAGCTSPKETQMYWDTQRANLRAEDRRLNGLYRAWFAQGFAEGWEGHDSELRPAGDNNDSEGDAAAMQGFINGQRDGRKARLAYQTGRAEPSTPPDALP